MRSRFPGRTLRSLLFSSYLPWCAAALVLLLTLGVGGIQAQVGPSEAGSPSAPPSTSGLPPWLAFHGSQRTRYETIDHRYGPTELGGDQQLAFRSRLQVQVTGASFWGMAEAEDARITLHDSGSTVTASHATGVKVLQLHVGARRRHVWGRGFDAQIEVGRVSRDFGDRRVLARQVDRNATSAFDGAIGRVGGKTWSAQGLYLRPRIYTYPTFGLDARFRGLSVSGVYASATRLRSVKAEPYLLRIVDGAGAPPATRRRITAPGIRLLGPLGASGRMD